MSDQPSERDVQEFSLALRRLERRYGFFRMQLSFTDATIIQSQLRLALRHPQNVGASAKVAQHLLDEITEALEMAEPSIGRFLRDSTEPSVP